MFRKNESLEVVLCFIRRKANSIWFTGFTRYI